MLEELVKMLRLFFLANKSNEMVVIAYSQNRSSILTPLRNSLDRIRYQHDPASTISAIKLFVSEPVSPRTFQSSSLVLNCRWFKQRCLFRQGIVSRSWKYLSTHVSAILILVMNRRDSESSVQGRVLALSVSDDPPEQFFSLMNLMFALKKKNFVFDACVIDSDSSTPFQQQGIYFWCIEVVLSYSRLSSYRRGTSKHTSSFWFACLFSTSVPLWPLLSAFPSHASCRRDKLQRNLFLP